MAVRPLQGTVVSRDGVPLKNTSLAIKVLDAQVNGSNQVIPPYTISAKTNNLGYFSVDLTLFSNPVTLTIEVEDGSASKTYTTTIDGDSVTPVNIKDIILDEFVPPSDTFTADLQAAITSASSPSGVNPFVTLQVLKDYSVPAGTKIVGPSGDFSTLTDALAAVAGQTADAPALIAIQGTVTETALITMKANTKIRLLSGSKLVIDTATQGAGITFNNISGAEIYGDDKTAEIQRKTGGVGGSNFVFNFINPTTSIPNRGANTLRRFIARNLCHTSIRNYGGAFRNVNLEDCSFYGAGTDRAYGAQMEVDVYAIRVDAYGGDELIGGSGGTVPVGLLISNGCTGRFEMCRGFGGNNGLNGECHGIWLFAYTGQNAPTLIKCAGYGGTATGGNNDGINGHKSASAILDSCIGIGGVRGHGIAAYGQSDNFARHLWINCVGICRNTDAVSADWHGLSVGDGAFRDRFEGGTFIGSPFVPSCGIRVATVAALAGGATSDPARALFQGVNFIGGGAGMEAQTQTTQQSDSYGALFQQTAHPLDFEDCRFLSNAASNPVMFGIGATKENVRLVGGTARSMRPDLFPAIRSVPGAEILAYGMKLYGGLAAGVTVPAQSLSGSNILVP